MRYLRTERSESGVETVWLARPPVNALSAGMVAELGAHLEALAGDPSLKALVITGEGRAFAAGADIEGFAPGADAPAPDVPFGAVFARIEAVPRPVIAAINGYALGGGLELALACDLRVMAESARVGLPEVQLGLIPGAGGTQRLPRLVGPARAKELIWTGRHVAADEALTLGLVDRVVPQETVVADAQAWAGSFAIGAVVAMGLAKRAIHVGLGSADDAGFRAEGEAFREAMRTEDARVGIESFLAHGPGKASFRGR